MNRRQFVGTVAKGSAAAMLGLHGFNLLAATGHEPPVNCSPPKHGAPKHITFNTKQAIQPRKSVWNLSTAEVQRLNAAYKALRDLAAKNPNDPRGWMQQANVHCFNCSGGYDPSNVEIHGSWWFLPWHRCYLHVHERILAKLINDPTFRLPYWDWDTYPAHAVLPPPYVPPGSLYDQWRGASPTDVIPSRITGPVAMQRVLGTQSTAGFMGQLSDPAHDKYYPGALENSPHGPVHLWTGYANPKAAKPPGCFYPNTAGGQPVDQSSNGCLDMGVLSNAAQDPVFFAHHGNIDRLWDVWLGMPGSQGNPTATNWKNQQFMFYDENGDWVYITIADVIGTNEQTNLRYMYQPPAKPVVMAATKQSGKPVLKAVKPLIIAAPAKPVAVGTKPHTASVALPAEHQQNLRALGASGKEAGKHYVLHIDGLTLPPMEGVVVDVFVDQPTAGLATELGPNFVGTFSVVPTGHHTHMVVRDARFELAPETAAILAAQKTLSVTLVPHLANGAEAAKSSLTYAKIYLTVE